MRSKVISIIAGAGLLLALMRVCLANEPSFHMPTNELSGIQIFAIIYGFAAVIGGTTAAAIGYINWILKD